MPRTTSGGTCKLCRKSYRKSGMTRHLQSCVTQTGLPQMPRRRPVKNIHLLVEDAHRPEYWIHLAMPASAALAELDQYLRDVWLECCLHLSCFRIAGVDYLCPEYFLSLYDAEDAGGNDPLAGMAQMLALLREKEEREMNVPLARIAPPGTRFRYEYDFGTTTELILRSVAEVDGPADAITPLARNDAPAIDCSICGAPATWISPSEHDWIAMTAGLCDACAPTTEYRLPLVNSPRCGVCAYDGTPMWIDDGDDDDSGDHGDGPVPELR